jgi:hypothetical protein
MDSFLHLKLHVYTTKVAIVNQILQKHLKKSYIKWGYYKCICHVMFKFVEKHEGIAFSNTFYNFFIIICK